MTTLHDIEIAALKLDGWQLLTVECQPERGTLVEVHLRARALANDVTMRHCSAELLRQHVASFGSSRSIFWRPYERLAALRHELEATAC